MHDSTVFYFATLALYDTYIFEERYCKKSAFNDSTYNSCLPQYLADSTLEELKEGCEIDDKNISITYQYGNSPGGFPLYNSHTYTILELTDSNLKISGPYPVAYLYGWNTGIFSFSK